jgi:hypothetical protein
MERERGREGAGGKRPPVLVSRYDTCRPGRRGLASLSACGQPAIWADNGLVGSFAASEQLRVMPLLLVIAPSPSAPLNPPFCSSFCLGGKSFGCSAGTVCRGQAPCVDP